MTASSESWEVQDPRIDPDRFILDGIDTSSGPLFKVSQVGEIFFARTSYWVRWLEEGHRLIIDGDPDCKHFEPITRTIEQEVDGALTDKAVKAHRSWLVDGVCTHCGGKEVATTRTPTGARVYTLSDIEKMTHAMAGNGAITGAQAALALLAVQTIARIHGYLP